MIVMRFLPFAGFAFAALAASPSAAFGLAPGAAVCASGYHTDRGGNCQPDAGEVSRYCPAGTVFHPQFHGWSCDPAPPEAY